MTTKELIKLKDGQYNLTDRIYDYILTVGRNSDKTKNYVIKEDGSLCGHSVFISESKTDGLYAISGIGGAYVHSSDVNSIIEKLKINGRNSIKDNS